MKLYITRHGQVSPNATYLYGNASLPRGEMNLSDLGKEQAALLGKQLVKRNFHGVILASPMWRTMETAEAIADETGSVILPTPWLHEIFCDEELLNAYRGSTIEQLKEWYPHVPKDADMAYPWWPEKVETSKDVMARISAGIDALLKEYGDTDTEILLVGHGASSGAADEYLDLNPDGMLWNCCLSMYDSKNPRASYGKYIGFLPGQMVTNNKHSSLDYTANKELEPPYEIRLPDEITNIGGVKLLHIGDTHSGTYSFYRKLISLVKPDVIVHTGDTADEDKVGWDTSAWDAYLTKAKVLADMLRDAGCPVYWVPGNNDLPDQIAKIAPHFTIVQPDSVIELEGVQICVAHAREQITKKAEIYLYGHGRKAEEHFADELSFMGKDSLCLNVMRSIYVVSLKDKTFHRIKRPD